jgi:hypothetical protein
MTFVVAVVAVAVEVKVVVAATEAEHIEVYMPSLFLRVATKPLI